MASPARINGTSLFGTAVIQRTSDADMLSCPSSSICAAAETRWPLSAIRAPRLSPRSEEHTSELQSLMRTSYAVFSLTKQTPPPLPPPHPPPHPTPTPPP